MKNVEMNITLAATLAIAINNNTIAAEQFDDCKKVAFEAMQKLLTGETLSGDEITVNSYVARQMQGIKTKAEKQAEIASKQAEAEAVYNREIQEHKKAIGEAVATFCKGVSIPKEGFTIIAVKTLFSDFLKTLPAGPKKPGVRSSTKSGNSGNGAKRGGLLNPVEGSFNHAVKALLPCTRENMKKSLKKQYSDLSEEKFERKLYVALYYMPIAEKDGSLVWNAPVELEIVTLKEK